MNNRAVGVLRIGGAILITPLVPALALPLVSAIAGEGLGLEEVLGRVALFYPYSLLALLVLGLPLYLLLRGNNLLSWWSGLAAGLLVGVVVAVMLDATQGSKAMMIAVGALAGVVFWALIGPHDAQQAVAADAAASRPRG